MKIGTLVEVIYPGSYHYGKRGTIVQYTLKGDPIVLIDDLHFHFKLSEIMPVISPPITTEFMKLTDKDTDYEAIYKEPIYFEFVNVGQALNRLKNFEYGIVNTTSNNKETIKFLVTDELSIVPLNIVQQEFRGIDLVKIIATYVLEGVEYNIHLKSTECKKVYETYANALEYVNKNNKK